MPRPSALPAPLVAALALAVGVALVAPAGCNPGSEASASTAAAPADSTEPAEAAPLPAASPAPDTVEARPPLPDGFVRLSEAAPHIALEIRYVTPFNFVGEPIDGYRAPECVLTTEAAAALAAVADDLARDGLGLKVYDCYRPQPAVDHFVRWIYTDDEAMKPAFFPTEPKTLLFRRGYIARRSGHSRGSTVDLTLVRTPAAASVVPASDYPAPGALPRCDAPRGERLDERDLDMGTAYDCLSPLAATASGAVPAEAQRNRRRLRDAMSRRGFRNYSKEWWHYTLRGEPHPGTHFDFPVE